MGKRTATGKGQNTSAALERRSQFLLSHLGFDPREATSLRVMASSINAPLIGSALAADTAAAIGMINSSQYVKEPLTPDGVHIHTVEAASTRFMPDRFAFMGVSTIANIAADCKAGIAFMTKHATGGDFSGPGENPYGRTFAGQFEQRADVSRALAQFYMLRAHNPNGSNAPSTDDLHRGLVGGTLFDFSIGLVRGGELTCDVCGEEIWSDSCSHCPGTTLGMTDEQIASQEARGIPDGCATFTFNNCHAGELSAVYNGAIPGASTAFSTGRKVRRAAVLNDTPTTGNAAMDTCDCCDNDPNCECSTNDNGACSCHADCATCKDNGCGGMNAMASQEETMFSSEFKASIGLLASATDAEVTAKIAEMQTKAKGHDTLASEVETLKLAQKKAADAAFEAAWNGKLSAETIADLKDLPTRDAMATRFAAQLDAAKGTVVQAPPPIGDPLKGASLAAAPVTPKPNEGETEESRIFRRSLGKFKTAEELAKFALIDPITAMEKWLSTSGVQVTLTREPLHENFARQTVEHRKAMLAGLTQ